MTGCTKALHDLEEWQIAALRLIPTRDEPIESGVICKLLELDGVVTEVAAVGVQGKSRLYSSLVRTGADGESEMCFHSFVLPPVGQEVCNPPPGDHAQLGDLALQQSQEDDQSIYKIFACTL